MIPGSIPTGRPKYVGLSPRGGQQGHHRRPAMTLISSNEKPCCSRNWRKRACSRRALRVGGDAPGQQVTVAVEAETVCVLRLDDEQNGRGAVRLGDRDVEDDVDPGAGVIEPPR